MTDLAPSKSYRLSDRALADTGSVFLSGVQALARLPLEQLRRDRRAGRRTAAFLSGYPGSPLGGFDREAISAAAAAPDLPIVVRPAVNEELAATAVMGSQLAGLQATARYDGVLGIWYGKTPGLDRAADALRHAVFAGADPAGGAVAFVGDDPSAKSSTLPSSSERSIEALAMPMFVPGSVAEVVELGRHAVAMSRVSGAWVAMRVVTQVADGTGTIDLAADAFAPVWPDHGGSAAPPPSGRLLAPYSLELERELIEVRLELARRYGELNPIDRITEPGRSPWIGIVAVGAVHGEVVEALARLGLTGAAIGELGIRLLHVRQPFPLDRNGVRRFADGLAEIVVVEEKRAFVETLVRDALYGRADPPLVLGKHDDRGGTLLRSYGVLDADSLVEPLRSRLMARVSPERLTQPAPPPRVTIPLTVNRSPHFCSGCPHNSSTKVPEGTLVGGGIGCSSLIALMPESQTGELIGLTAMGTEGANWIGMAPFVDRPHLVQYLGDGTYAHSGHLAVRAAVAAGVDITYKVLYNGAVSMTGGQHAEGVLSAPDLARSMLLEGVARVVITTDDPGSYDRVDLPAEVEVWGRERMVEAQETLAAIRGTTMLIHDQACATELRRARKRGLVAEPTRRVVINERVCEGCGDCGAVSNCLSVQPVETPFGRKTRIDQASCNLDLSCLGGDCPAFATVELRPTRRAPRSARPSTAELPEPVVAPWSEHTIRMSGIGGTGVVTVSQVLGTAALLDGLHALGLDQTGLSQKAGPVVSDLRLSVDPPTGSNRAPTASVDVELAFDLLVASTPAHLAASRPGRTVVIGSTSITPTGSMVIEPSLRPPSFAELRTRLDQVSDPSRSRYADAARICVALVGDAAPANVFLVGVAIQAGVIPVHPESFERAIELNGVAVDLNIDAFRWGRRWTHDRAAVEQAAGLTDPSAVETLDELIARLRSDLIGYQSRSYAARWQRLVDQARAAGSSSGTSTEFAAAVARNAHKLMAYKDEYEVARLLLAPEARAALDAVGGRGARVSWHLKPPSLSAVGLDRKVTLGRSSRPALALLRRGKRLRGTLFDPFARAEVRRVERAMVGEYERAIARLVAGLRADNLDEAIAIAELPDQVRGFEALKLRRAEAYRAELARRLDAFEGR